MIFLSFPAAPATQIPRFFNFCCRAVEVAGSIFAMTRFAASFLVVSILFATSAGAGDVSTSQPAKDNDADPAHVTNAQKATDEYHAKLESARNEYKAALRQALSAATRKRDRAEANRIRALLRDVGRAEADAAAPQDADGPTSKPSETAAKTDKPSMPPGPKEVAVTKPPKPVEIPEVPIKGELISLLGQSPLPQYLKCDQSVLGGPEGLHDGTVSTIATDFGGKDFVFDAVFTLKQGDERAGGTIGIGGPGPGAVAVNLFGPAVWAGTGQIITPNVPPRHFAPLIVGLDYLVRMEKKGDTLTFSVTPDFKGKFRPEMATMLPSLKTVAPQLSRLNSNLYLAGTLPFRAVRLEVDGKVIPAGPDAKAYPEAAPKEGAGAAVPGDSIAGELASLLGQSGIPKYLKCEQAMLGGPEGLHDGVARTLATDYFDKDFVLDAVFELKPGDERKGGTIGIGSPDSGPVAVNLYGPGVGAASQIAAPQIEARDFALLQIGPPCLVRMEKKGDSLAFSVTFDFKGKYRPDIIKTLPSLKTSSPRLSRLSSELFFGGALHFTAVRLVVDGKTVDPGVHQASYSEPAANDGWVHFIPGASLPPYLEGAAGVTIGNDGLQFDGKSLRTKSSDFLTHDFTLDVVYYFRPDEGGQLRVGIGENGAVNNSIANSVTGLVVGPMNDGVINFTYGALWNAPTIGKLGKGHPGPSLFRLQKRGDTLLMGVCADYNDKYEPDFVCVVPSLRSQAQSVNEKNSWLFIGGNGGSIKRMRLVVDGKTVGAPVDAAPAEASNGDENFVRLTGPKLPGLFEPVRDLKFAEDGLNLKDVHLRTRQADYVNKNFTYDVVFHFTPERSALLVGLGADEREGNWIRKSVVGRLMSPVAGGDVQLVMENVADATLGHLGNDTGPHMLRMQKHGNALTFALCINYRGTFTPDFIRTLPDLKAAMPTLGAKNSRIFMDDGGVVEKVRLTVEGEATESSDLALDIPPKVVAGRAVHVQVIKAAGARRFAPDEGAPKGLAISPAGELAWTPGGDQVGRHEFKIKITENGRSVLQTVGIEVIGVDDAQAVGGDLSKVDSLYRLPLESDKAKVVAGLGATLLVLEGDVLRRLDSDGISVSKSWKLPRTYQWIGEREAYFVAMSDENKSLDFIDKGTSKVTRSVQMDYSRRNDLCLNPVRPITYVSVDKASGEGGFIKSILVVDEPSGDVHEPPRFIGTFLKASPDGSRLFAAYKDIYKRGEELLINPDRIDVVPRFGSIEILIAYDITRPSQPAVVAAKNEAGGNSYGLAISSDGKRLSYLSHVGYPLFSGNIPAWDPTDLTKRPISYPAKANHADCRVLAFHPMLPIAAAPSETYATCFGRETGEVEADRLDVRTPLDDLKVHDLIFSPDGKSLILKCQSGGDYFLRRVRLRLSDAELAKVKDGPPPVVPVKPAAPEHDDQEPRLKA